MGRGKKWYRKQRTQRTYMYNPWAGTKWGNAAGWGDAGRREDKWGAIGKTVIA